MLYQQYPPSRDIMLFQQYSPSRDIMLFQQYPPSRDIMLFQQYPPIFYIKLQVNVKFSLSCTNMENISNVLFTLKEL